MNMLKKLFGGQESFYLEIDENKNKETESPTAEVPAKEVAEKAPAVAKTEEVSTTAEVPAKEVAEKAPAVVKTEEVGTAVVAGETTAVSEKTTPKKKQKKTTSKKKQAEAATSVTTPTPSGEPPLRVKAMNTKTSPQAKAAQGMTFAPKYLMSNGSRPRRRPGPSMNMFKEMASQLKKPMG